MIATTYETAPTWERSSRWGEEDGDRRQLTAETRPEDKVLHVRTTDGKPAVFGLEEATRFRDWLDAVIKNWG